MDGISSSMAMSAPTGMSAIGNGVTASAENIQEIGQEFESVFVSMLLKEMRNSLDEGFFGGEASDSFGGMFDMFIGQHLSKSNALGVGQMLAEQYNSQQDGKPLVGESLSKVS
ncbi:rod-binding protein [Stieleria sp. JC731]|uniref:rod-binding protein n=1 Tax=Pirellulaceae TaxID=2691357 RepID=UPI001E38F7ED|nr:rod-binding protein [Stieleria sp. JC731]MCC9602948.1 rod-binding protein [Stieleria sp. JC731]